MSSSEVGPYRALLRQAVQREPGAFNELARLSGSVLKDWAQSLRPTADPLLAALRRSLPSPRFLDEERSSAIQAIVSSLGREVRRIAEAEIEATGVIPTIQAIDTLDGFVTSATPTRALLVQHIGSCSGISVQNAILGLATVEITIRSRLEREGSFEYEFIGTITPGKGRGWHIELCPDLQFEPWVPTRL